MKKKKKCSQRFKKKEFWIVLHLKIKIKAKTGWLTICTLLVGTVPIFSENSKNCLSELMGFGQKIRFSYNVPIFHNKVMDSLLMSQKLTK